MQQLIRLDQVLVRTALSRTRLYECVDAGTFPRPVKLGGNARAIAWPAAEVDEWIAARIAARDEAERERAA